MRIKARMKNGLTILDIEGPITIGDENGVLSREILGLLDSEQNQILLNLAQVGVVDSTGIGELVRCFTHVTRVGGQLKLLNLTKRLRELLYITKLLTVFESFDDEAKAVASFGNEK